MADRALPSDPLFYIYIAVALCGCAHMTCTLTRRTQGTSESSKNVTDVDALQGNEESQGGRMPPRGISFCVCKRPDRVCEAHKVTGGPRVIRRRWGPWEPSWCLCIMIRWCCHDKRAEL